MGARPLILPPVQPGAGYAHPRYGERAGRIGGPKGTLIADAHTTQHEHRNQETHSAGQSSSTKIDQNPVLIPAQTVLAGVRRVIAHL